MFRKALTVATLLALFLESLSLPVVFNQPDATLSSKDFFATQSSPLGAQNEQGADINCYHKYCFYVQNKCRMGLAVMVRSHKGEDQSMTDEVLVAKPWHTIKIEDSDFPLVYMSAYAYQDPRWHWPTYNMPGAKEAIRDFSYKRSKDYQLLFWKFSLEGYHMAAVPIECGYY